MIMENVASCNDLAFRYLGQNWSVSQKFGYLDLISFEILDFIFYLVQLLELEMEEI